MKFRMYLGFFVLLLALSGCDNNEDPTVESPFKPFDGVEDVPANCNVEVVKVKRITADDVSDDAKLGDYFFTLKSVKTEKEKISLEGRYAKSGEAAAIVTVVWNGKVGIDETIEIKISSDDINTEEDFDCMEYVVKVEVDGSSDCEFVATDC